MKTYTSILSNLEFYHSIKSKCTKNGKTIIILNYDYFLQKRDLKYLLIEFENIVLIPLEESERLLNKNLLEQFSSDTPLIKIVYNPDYQEISETFMLLNVNRDQKIEIQNVFDFCELVLRKCYVSDNFYVKNPYITNLTYFSVYPRIVKKAVDLVCGFLIYVLTQPLWLLSAIRIHLDSPGPIFYRQKRVGINGKEFSVIKFRSMKLDAEITGAQFAKKNDDRIFNWGKIMRKTRIDELPQLFNILKGELSLIGPRPERRFFVDSFAEEIPQYNERHKVKPGISGYAQIMYPYGSGAKDARHKLMYDLYYIKNWSFGLEISILIRTFWTVITKRGI